MSVMIVTSLGEMVLDLFTDRCPLTCKNFLKLCKIKYYNGCLFHTVQKDFTAQTGDPTGTGSGGDSVYKFLYGEQARFFGDEIHLDLKHSKMGTVAMVSAGENLNASQFYITLRDDLDYLDGKHTVFGEIAEGLDTLNRINEAYVDEKGRPFKNIRIKHTYILDDPFDDPAELSDLIPDASPEGKPKDEVEDDVRLEDDWVPMDEQLGIQELEEVLHEKEAHSRAVVLESVGDIPDAEIKPPDNVLFVCKLNPVTEDEDLYTIFSRFGTVTSAEIIRDFKTGDSLCYAFIEFEDKEACEQAYYKMDNTLIDDRRIHVDFSQSVAKLWSQYRRKDQLGKGRGCFKCGSLDHVAKDCTGDATKQQSNYVLKEDNKQRGGDGNSRYEMVFDEDAVGSPKGNKRGRDYEDGKHQENHNPKHRELNDDGVRKDRKRYGYERHRQEERSKDYRTEERHRGSGTRPNVEKERDYRGRNDLDYRRNTDYDNHKAGRERPDHDKRHADKVRHGDKGNRRESEKRDQKDEVEYGGGHADEVRYRDNRNERGYEKRQLDSRNRGRGEEQDRGKRGLEGDRAHDRERERYHDHDRHRDRGRRN
ncbi:peptidyl-prolyl cis-trans isomerase CYP59 [Nicotiana tomentosiformis]|uniref:peptidyl-prolyl cis-trans isomerase CYP59 n=1 Tax=Nicotiana tomentosiformis TaxID=4098 RepID=UPI00051C9E72|nr:peptidyl-prolyl cis-trans isomerase CYP59 [Nicotiana tomentosiformis]